MSVQILKKKKNSNVKFHETLSSGSPVVPCGQTDRRTDMTKLTVSFAIFRTNLKIKEWARLEGTAVHREINYTAMDVEGIA